MSPMNRRRFLQTSVAAAAALSSAPHIAKAKDPNGKLGVAVVGVRGRGGDHINGFLGDARTVILYLVDPDEKEGLKRCDQVTKKQGIKPKFVRDMREAFQDPAVDLVGSATPNHWHALSAIWAMQAGKDVYVEKPVCHDIAEGTAMIAAARKYGRICQVGTQCRSHQAIQEAMKFLHEGGIGDVNLARGLCYKRRKSIGPKGDYPVPPEVDFSLWSGPAPFTTPKVTRPQFHYDWHWQRLYGNGDSGNQGPHQTDIARWGLGMDRHPSSVISYGGRLGYQAERQDDSYIDAGDTPNTEVSIFDYGDKCLVFETRGLSVDDCADEELNRLFGSNKGGKVGVVFYGSEGYLVQRTYTDCEAFDKQFKSIKQFKGGGDHYGNFIDACISRKHQDLNADVREGHLSAALAHLGNISYYLGEANKVSADEAAKVLSGSKSRDDNRATLERTLQHLKDNGNDLAKYPISLGPLLKFDPAKEVFPDTPEATAMVRREYREGFVCPAAEKV
ncbi:MAG TPA: Gfo/Idh/MocA family oxidoreductase [Candidatus Anammoximicrobium sp.]|nr:Gfo/Idh/MocA family oxidoreductase [Candidatus Anammoximicrobium sp.]